MRERDGLRGWSSVELETLVCKLQATGAARCQSKLGVWRNIELTVNLRHKLIRSSHNATYHEGFPPDLL
jgi:hypothetical protein